MLFKVLPASWSKSCHTTTWSWRETDWRSRVSRGKMYGLSLSWWTTRACCGTATNQLTAGNSFWFVKFAERGASDFLFLIIHIDWFREEKEIKEKLCSYFLKLCFLKKKKSILMFFLRCPPVSQWDIRWRLRFHQRVSEDGAAAHGNHTEDLPVRNVRYAQVEQRHGSQVSRPAVQSVSPPRLCHAECGPDAECSIWP